MSVDEQLVSNLADNATPRRRVLVTGATGFIGENVMPLLRSRGWEVHHFLRRKNFIGPFQHQVDLHDRAAVLQAMQHIRPDALLHLAWTKSWAEPSDEHLRWTASSIELLRAFTACGGKRFVGAGSCAEYAPSGSALLEGQTELPTGVYGLAKRLLGQLSLAHAEQCGLSAAWCRIFYVYGGDEREHRLLPSIVRAVQSNVKMKCTGGNQDRDYVHVSDVACAIVHVLEGSFHGAVNIGSGKTVRIRDLATRVAELAGGGASDIEFGAARRDDEGNSLVLADTTRLREQIGFTPAISLEQGLNDAVAEMVRRSRVEMPGAVAQGV